MIESQLFVVRLNFALDLYLNSGALTDTNLSTVHV